MDNLETKIGLEIHVQLKTKSKMFCRCNNEAFGAKPNTTVCPICLGMPGTLPVANKQAVLWTIKTGLALNCTINKIAKFDRKHYFYPDLPKGYQISQYDEPFCSGGYLEVSNVISTEVEKSSDKRSLDYARDDKEGTRDDSKRRIRLNRIHLEEDAGKLIHSGVKSLVDLNRAGTPLMEIVTEPDITSPKEAGDFLRKLQKIVRDEVSVSEASMEKGHMRCDANISVSDENGRMSKIVELKNLNSFRFVEKALEIEERKLKEEYPNWPEKRTKATHGYDSKKNETYVQRQKEEASDYRYFPEPDLPPFDSSEFDLDALKSEIGRTSEEKLDELLLMEIAESDAGVLISDSKKDVIFHAILKSVSRGNEALLARAIVHNYFGFSFNDEDSTKAEDYAKAVEALASGTIQKHNFAQIALEIHNGSTFDTAFSQFSESGEKIDLEKIIDEIISANAKELEAYRAGKTQLLGFFMGQAMRATAGKANPNEISRVLQEKLKKG